MRMMYDVAFGSGKRPFPRCVFQSMFLIFLLRLCGSLSSFLLFFPFSAGDPNPGLAQARLSFTTQLQALVPDKYILKLSPEGNWSGFLSLSARSRTLDFPPLPTHRT